jgi:sensor histidine kinase YesM
MIIYSLFEYFIRYMAIDPNGPSLLSLQRTKSELLWLLILLQVVFISVTFLISVFMSHKVAGPIYKMRKFLQDSRGGIFNRELVFRKKDHFMELAQDYNHAMKGVSELMIQARSHLDTAVAEIETLAPHAPSGDKARAESTLVALKAARDRIPT